MNTSTEISILPLVRQSQSLQLCAVMTINNLLQLTDEPHGHGHGGHEQVMLLCGGKLLRRQQDVLSFATTTDLNDIADELILCEADLFHGNIHDDKSKNQKPNSGTVNTKRKASRWQVIRSRHRTPLFGNYSFEVLEAALLRRNVELEWFTDCSSSNASLMNPFEDTKSSTSTTIGFVINSIQPFSYTNAITGMFSTSRHWWAITRIRRVKQIQSLIDDDGGGGGEGAQVFDIHSATFHDSHTQEQVEYLGNEWSIVNSQDTSDTSVRSMTSGELRIFLAGVMAEKGHVFRATMSL